MTRRRFINGLRVMIGTVLLGMAGVFAYLAASFDQSRDSGEGIDIMMTAILGFWSLGLATGGLALLPIRWPR